MAPRSTKAKTEAKAEKAVVETAAKAVKAEPAKKEAAKKAPAKKVAVKAAEPVIKCTIEFAGKNTAVRSIVDSIFDAEGGKDKVKTLDVYVQPENNVAYYVVNGNEEGKSVEF